MISKIEYLQQSAQSAELPLAPTPLVYFLNDAGKYLNRLAVNTRAIREFMEPQAGDDLYKHMFIGIVPRGEMACYGSVDDSLFEFENHTYFPKILLGVDTKKDPNVPRLNSTLRHELAHTLQPNEEAPYNSHKTVMRARGVGSTLLAAGTVLGDACARSVESMNMPGIVASGTAIALLGTLGASNLITPRLLMRRCAPTELQADGYAIKHKDFNPIAYS